jgi:hypothetical protein
VGEPYACGVLSIEAGPWNKGLLIGQKKNWREPQIVGALVWGGTIDAHHLRQNAGSALGQSSLINEH